MIGLRTAHQQRRQQREERARSDIARLLDPSYGSSYYSTPQPAGVYIDAQGTFHDPDYRDFPLISSTAITPSSISRRQRQAASHWESEDEDDLPQDYYTTFYSGNKRNSYPSYPLAGDRPVPARTRQQQPSYYYRRSTSPSSGAILVSTGTGVSPLSAFDFPSASTSSSSSSSPSMLSRAQSPFDSSTEETASTPVKEKSSTRCRIAASLKRKRRSSSLSASEVEASPTRNTNNTSTWDDSSRWRFVQDVPEESEEDMARDDEESEKEEEKKRNRVRTRSEALIRQWRVMSMNIQFGLFRARKRVRSLI